ncbi:MAG: hypothetical protein FJ088_13380 [Deltaproteobacteria bacterium]|nr:hypothetical protein [Deltaproteobacteria bacterium]
MISLGLKPEMQARMTTEWASYRHALAAFLRRINLVDAPQYFAEVLQRSFSFEGENQK